MNALRNLEIIPKRSHQNNVNSQSQILFDIVQKAIDINKASRRVQITDVVIYDENIALLNKKGITVRRDDSESNIWVLSW